MKVGELREKLAHLHADHELIYYDDQGLLVLEDVMVVDERVLLLFRYD